MRTFEYNGVPVLIKEGALGDGVGAKVWTVAHTLCRSDLLPVGAGLVHVYTGGRDGVVREI